ncbi:MAG: T9SS type A sorting domain-containing protein [Chitinophagales bacterium]
MKNRALTFSTLLGLLLNTFNLWAQEYPFRTATYYYKLANDSLISSGLTLNSFDFGTASRTNDSIFTDGIYFPANDCFGRNLWIRVRHIAEDPNGINRGFNVQQTTGNPCIQAGNNITLGGWGGFLYEIEIYRDTALNTNRSYCLGGLYPTSITVSSLEWMSGICGGSEWVDFGILNSGSTGWSLNAINFTGINPNSNPGFSDTMAVYTTGGCYPPDGFSYTFPQGADSVSFINASTNGYSEFKMSAGNVSRFIYGYEYTNGYQGMSMAFGSPPSFTFNTQSPTCTNGKNGNITVNINGGIGPFTYHWSDTTNTQSGNAINNLSAGVYRLTVTDQNGCGQVTDTVIVITDPVSGITTSPSITNLTCFGTNDGIFSINATSSDSLSYLWNTGDTSSTLDNLSVGIYTCTVTSVQGCCYNEGIIVQPARSDTGITIIGNTLTCHVNKAFVTYEWIDCLNNTIIPNNTDSVFTAVTTGAYKAVLTQIFNGCKDTTACCDVVVNTINNNATAEKFSMYPNPATDIIHLRYDLEKNELAIIELIDVMGKIVKSYQLSPQNNHSFDISITDLAKGMYLLKFVSANKKMCKRIITQ